MAKPLDFNALKKRYLSVTLPDEKKTKLMISTPTKKVLDSFLNMQSLVNAEDLGDQAINEIYELVTKIMSYNKNGIKITKDMIEELFDFEDIIIFITAYSEFISEIANSKN